MESERRVVQIIGDGMDGTWLTWRWNDPQIPVGVHRIDGLAEVLSDFHAALPGGSTTDLSDQRLKGPFSDPEAEFRLMTRLAETLVPERLGDEILSASGQIEVRVMPSPPLARVPWGLLAVGERGRRLVEVADVSWIGPLLPRDIASEPVPDPDRDDRLGVYLLDPFVYGCGAVMPRSVTLEAWNAGGARAVILKRYSDDEDSRDEERVLDQLREGLSRLFLLGHVQVPGQPGETAFLIGEGRLSPADLLSSDVCAPPRVAIVACASGTDFEGSEPLGLATAFLLYGADTVQATLWPIPTEAALAAEDRNATGAFLELAKAFDRAQQAADPVHALCDYQRQRLEAWREEPVLRNSPILWATAMTITAPRRRNLAADRSQQAAPLRAAQL